MVMDWNSRTVNTRFGFRTFFPNENHGNRPLVHGVNGHLVFHSVKKRFGRDVPPSVPPAFYSDLIRIRLGACLVVLLCLAIVLAGGCNRDRLASSKNNFSGQDNESLSLAVTTPALFYLAREIAGGYTDVFLVGCNEPANAAWSPDATAISGMQKADLIIYNGAGFETWLHNITVPARVLVDATAIHELELIPVVNSQTHQHGPSGQQSKMVYASQVWHDPSILRRQAMLVRDELTKSYPEHTIDFGAECAKVVGKLDELMETIGKATGRNRSVSIVDPTNRFSYLIRAFQLIPLMPAQDLLLIDARSITEQDLATLDEISATKAIVLLPNDTSFDLLQVEMEQRHIPVLRLDSLEILSDDKAFIDRLRENLEQISKAIW